MGPSSAVKVGPWGGRGGTPRDIPRRGVKAQRLESITIRSTDSYGGRINGFSFVYQDMKGKSIGVGTWGSSSKGYEDTITLGDGEVVNHMRGTADEFGVTSLTFMTNQGVEYGTYGCPSGTAFSVPLQQGGSHALGFFGRSDDSLVALGAYVAASPETAKLGPWGGRVGTPRDVPRRGVKPQRLESITVRSTDSHGGRINGFSFVYVDFKGQSISIGTWGSSTKGYEDTIMLGEEEYVKDISGTVDQIGVTSLKFVTNMGEYGSPYGCPSGTAFSVPCCNGEVIGFFGRSGDSLVALGTYVAPRSCA